MLGVVSSIVSCFASEELTQPTLYILISIYILIYRAIYIYQYEYRFFFFFIVLVSFFSFSCRPLDVL